MQRMRRKEPEEKEWESAIQQDGVGDGQPGPRVLRVWGKRSETPGVSIHAPAACCALQGTGASVDRVV